MKSHRAEALETDSQSSPMVLRGLKKVAKTVRQARGVNRIASLAEIPASTVRNLSESTRQGLLERDALRKANARADYLALPVEQQTDTLLSAIHSQIDAVNYPQRRRWIGRAATGRANSYGHTQEQLAHMRDFEDSSAIRLNLGIFGEDLEGQIVTAHFERAAEPIGVKRFMLGRYARYTEHPDTAEQRPLSLVFDDAEGNPQNVELTSEVLAEMLPEGRLALATALMNPVDAPAAATMY